VRQFLQACVGIAAGFLIASSTASPCVAQADGLNPDVGQFVHDTYQFVALIHDGTTLGHWLDTRNPNDQWADYEEECHSYFTIDRSPSGIMIPWKLYFYPPPAPKPVTFPDHASSRDCVLGTIQVEAEDRGHPELAKQMDTAIREILVWKFGPSASNDDIPFWGPYPYPDSERWIINAEVIAGHSSEISHCDNLHGPLLAMGDTAFVCGQSSLVRRQELDVARTYRYRDLEDERFHQALVIAAADPVLTAKLEKLYTEMFHNYGQQLLRNFQEMVDGSNRLPATPPPSWLPSLLPSLQEWLAQVKTFPTERRAAGLLAADHLLSAGQIVAANAWPQKEKDQFFKKLSAEITPEEVEYGYNRSWAGQARQLDPTGAVGKMATIGLIAHGPCAWEGDEDPSRRVIVEGERLLSEGVDAPTAAQVHFMVGDAYSDFVSLAAQGLDAHGGRDPNRYRAEAATDRTKAMEHYRAGLAVDSASQNAQDAWRQAWRILAGLQPEQRYVCFDEGD
jgi:hypothetical protein